MITEGDQSTCENKTHWLDSFRPIQAAIFGALFLLVIMGADFCVINTDIRFTPLYFFPIAVVSWKVRVKWIVLFVLMTSVGWFFNEEYWRADRFRLLDFWNLMVASCSFSSISYLVFQVRRHYEKQRDLNAKLNRTLEEVTKLQNNVLVMCAWSHRIKDEGKWVSLEEFMTKHFNLKMSHGISPEELTKIQKAIENPGEISDNPQ